ncbi:MAG: EamA family transporter [Streptosporangiales bacterium]|nr:EamA family transporter [Streptosporangiales bacterium]
MSAALALLASALWGAADFYGGALSRRLHVFTVVFVSQAVALVVFGAGGLLTGALETGGPYLIWGTAAGIAGPLALFAFYRALAVGRMGVVAPLAATGVAVPVLFGVVSGERPSAGQVAGMVAVVVGIVLAAGPEARGGTAASIGLALAAALGFGLVFVFLAEGGASDAYATIVVQRAVNVVLVGAVLAAMVLAGAGYRGRTPGRLLLAHLPLLAFVGVADAAANLAYAVASRHGLISITAVLASLYPVVTAVLARYLHRERLRPVQVTGAAATMGGVLLLAAA